MKEPKQTLRARRAVLWSDDGGLSCFCIPLNVGLVVTEYQASCRISPTLCQHTVGPFKLTSDLPVAAAVMIGSLSISDEVRFSSGPTAKGLNFRKS
jgi:hypothetical protein